MEKVIKPAFLCIVLLLVLGFYTVAYNIYRDLTLEDRLQEMYSELEESTETGTVTLKED